MDRRTAERLLQRDTAIPHADHHPRLAALLAAASSPAHPGELVGESAAMAAFAAARHSPAPSARKPTMVRVALTRLLTIRAAAITGLVVAGVGGVTLAASAGALPAPTSSHLPGNHTGQTAHPQPDPTPSSTAPPRSAAPAAPAAPAGLAALCRDFHHRGDEEHRGKALDEQHFAELVRQAGKKDPDRVDRFCARLEPAETSSSRPSVTTSPGSHPNDSTRASNPPSTRPGEHPGYPSGKPSTPPTRPTPTRPLR